jgi:hypothetical protein
MRSHLAVVVVLLSVGCGGPADEPGDAAAPYASESSAPSTSDSVVPHLPEVVDTPGLDDFAEAGEWIGSTCGLSGCHLIVQPPSLSASDLDALRESLMGYRVERCGNAPMIVPGDPEGSALVMATTGQCMGLLMPFGCTEPYGGVPCVPESEMQRVRDWISSADPFR